MNTSKRPRAKAKLVVEVSTVQIRTLKRIFGVCGGTPEFHAQFALGLCLAHWPLIQDQVRALIRYAIDEKLDWDMTSLILDDRMKRLKFPRAIARH